MARRTQGFEPGCLPLPLLLLPPNRPTSACPATKPHSAFVSFVPLPVFSVALFMVVSLPVTELLPRTPGVRPKWTFKRPSLALPPPQNDAPLPVSFLRAVFGWLVFLNIRCGGQGPCLLSGNTQPRLLCNVHYVISNMHGHDATHDGVAHRTFCLLACLFFPAVCMGLCVGVHCRCCAGQALVLRLSNRLHHPPPLSSSPPPPSSSCHSITQPSLCCQIGNVPTVSLRSYQHCSSDPKVRPA